MPEADELRVERKGHIQIVQALGGLFIEKADETDTFRLDPADLLWLVTTGGPAMIALLGGPHAITAGAQCLICRGPREKPNTVSSGLAKRDQHHFADRPGFSEGGARKVCEHGFHSGKDQRGLPRA